LRTGGWLPTDATPVRPDPPARDTPVNRTIRPGFLLLAVATPFLAGVVAFLVAGLAAGMGVEVVPVLFEQAGQRRLNPLLAGIVGLVPVLLLLLILAVGPRLTPRAGWGPTVAWTGLIPIILLELWAHWEVWTLYLPSRATLSFPHGLELVIVPLFFAPVGVVVGVGLGLWLERSKKHSDASAEAGGET